MRHGNGNSGLDGIKATVHQLIFPSLHHYYLLDMAILCHNLILDWQTGGSTTMFHCLHFAIFLMQDLALMECDSLKTALLKGASTAAVAGLAAIQDFLPNFILQCN